MVFEDLAKRIPIFRIEKKKQILTVRVDRELIAIITKLIYQLKLLKPLLFLFLHVTISKLCFYMEMGSLPCLIQSVVWYRMLSAEKWSLLTQLWRWPPESDLMSSVRTHWSHMGDSCSPSILLKTLYAGIFSMLAGTSITLSLAQGMLPYWFTDLLPFLEPTGKPRKLSKSHWYTGDRLQQDLFIMWDNNTQ